MRRVWYVIALIEWGDNFGKKAFSEFENFMAPISIIFDIVSKRRVQLQMSSKIWHQ